MPNERHVVEHPFAFGETVAPKGEDLRMIVTGITYRRGDQPLIECAYWHNGTLTAVALPEYRIERVKT